MQRSPGVVRVAAAGRWYFVLAACLWSLLPATRASAEELRTWSDSTGKFSVRAKFVALDDGKVKLQRDDGTEMQVELKRLSEGDQKYVANLSSNPFQETPKTAPAPDDTPAPKDTETPGAQGKLIATAAKTATPDWSAAREVSLTDALPGWSVTVPPVPPPAPAKKAKPIATGPKADFFEHTKGLVVSAACHRAVAGYIIAPPGGEAKTRLLLVDLVRGKALGSGTLPGQYVPVALLDNGMQVLMRRDEFHFGTKDRLELWTLTKTGIEKGIQWTPYDDLKNTDRDVKWAEMVDATRLMTVSGSGKLALWKLDTAQPSYFLKIAGNSLPALSPNKKLLAFGDGKQIGLLDVEAGKVVALKSVGHIPWPVLSFSPDGTRLACAMHGKLWVWDVATGNDYREMSIPAMGGDSDLCWTSATTLLVGKNLLIDIENQVPLWRYDGHEFVEVLDGVCWFKLAEAHKGPGALVPGILPHAEAKEKLAKAVAAPDFYVLKAGTTVRVNVAGVADAAQQEKVRQSLTEKLKANGFKVGPDGTIDLVAVTEVGKQRKVSYHTFGIGHQTQTYQIQEHIAAVRFMYQGKAAWQSSSVNVPGMIHLKEGETIAGVLREHEKPNYAFFDHVELPKVLTKPGDAATLGTSQITPAGL